MPRIQGDSVAVGVARTLILALCLFAVLAPAGLANGGTVQVSEHVSGPYQLSVFTSPSPIRVGTVDVSVLVQRPGSNEVVQDAVVLVSVQGVQSGTPAEVYEATHEQATNKLYYAANVHLPIEGRWAMEVVVLGQQGEATASFEVQATRETLMDRPAVLAAIIALPVVLVLGWMALGKRRGSSESEGGTP
jgi:hypothetical protein